MDIANYDTNLTEQIKKFSNSIDFDFNKISRINIITYDIFNNFEGMAIPVFKNNNLYFELKLHKNISDSFYKDNDFEKSVVYHELFHCKEMNISNKYVDLQKIFIESRYFTTSYKFLLNIGYMQWSEYYAYFNSTRYHIPNWFLYDDLKNVDISLKSIANIFTQNTISHTHVGISLLNDITNLVACFIRIAACYNSSHNSKYRTEIQKCCKVSNYKYYNPYFLDISCYMNDLYNNYPNWISEEAFIELGKKLISFIGIYGLYLKNGSLHENFEFYKLL